MSARVLVTRPEPGAARTAARLNAAGFEAVTLPLTEITPLEFSPPHGPFDALAVTSGQALRAGNFKRFAGLPIFAVGETTATAARAGGFVNVITAGGAIASIIDLVTSRAQRGSRLLYVCGRVRRQELELELAAAGFAVTPVETYDAQPVGYDRVDIATKTGAQPIAAAVLMSVQAASLFSVLMREAAFGDILDGAVAVCFSQRIADAVDAAGLRLAITSRADEDSLMEFLAQRFPA